MCAAVPGEQLYVVHNAAAAESILLAVKASTILSPATSYKDIERHVH